MPRDDLDLERRVSWFRDDPEQKLAFRGGRFTRVNTWCALVLGIVGTCGFYGVMVPLRNTYFAVSFTQRGYVPYAIVFFSFWSLAIIVLKHFKLRLQRQSLDVQILPGDPQFVLTPSTSREVTQRIDAACDDPARFLLFNRIEVALSNLRNLGRVTDVDEILRSQASSDESGMETSYALLQTFIWAIPVLGFIGTVEGLAKSVGGFGDVLATTKELAQIKDSLKVVTGGLSIAFETTLQGLLAALVIQLLVTALKKAEEEFLDDCSEYCVRNIVGRLKLTAIEPGEGA
ncbi:MAG TPA: MotA/TolQ/ExbB proton channel family protein [Caulifigura sp.]|jgi:biopolymer transport protein ExbB/TolQ|nr:MotA/TolQ/ExbB proton channel family protein [Caulifigura sp.]